MIAGLLLVTCLGAGDNLAVHKQYALSPKPDYPLTTDSGDRFQLTDGRYANGTIWRDSATVGWRKGQLITITVDLGKVYPVQGAAFSTAAGKAGVEWPDTILLLTSNDGKDYTFAGDLVKMDRKEGGEPVHAGYSRYSYRTERLQTHARYVRIIVSKAGRYLFVDEIEILEGSAGSVQQPQRKEEPLDQLIARSRVAKGVHRRLRNDLNVVKQALHAVGKDAVYGSDVRRIEAAIDELVIEHPAEFNTTFPINQLHEQIFSLQAAAWRASGIHPGLNVWQTDAWAMLSPTQRPNNDGARLDVRMMRNEYRSAAFNLTNAAATPIELELSIEGLPGGRSPGYVMVHEVPFTDTKRGQPVASALLRARKNPDGYQFTLTPGLTKQIWLTFHPTDLSAAIYNGRIRLRPADISIPIRFQVYPFDFPDRPTLQVGGWDYTDSLRYDVTPANRHALIEQLQAHLITAPWAHSSTLGKGRYDQVGRMVGSPDTGTFDTWISRWPHARRYYIFLSVKDDFAQFELGSEAHRRAVTNWIEFWLSHAHSKGIAAGSIALLLVDENKTHEADRRVIEYARILKEANEHLLVWQNPAWRDPNDALPRMFEVSDVLSPNLSRWISEGERHRKFYMRQRAKGKELAFYSSRGPAKLLDPYTYYRLQSWFCWRYGAAGSFFWAFGDSNGGSSWNEYNTTFGGYTPLFLSPTRVSSSKHIEAIREGVEDYQYLHMLKKRVNDAASIDQDSDDLAAARQLLHSAAERVTESVTQTAMFAWNSKKNRTMADRVRVEILETLVELDQKYQSQDEYAGEASKRHLTKSDEAPAKPTEPQ